MANEGVDVVTSDEAKHWSMSPLEHGWERKSGKLVPVQWRQSSWKVSSAHAQVEFAAQTTVQSERFVLHRAVHKSWQ